MAEEIKFYMSKEGEGVKDLEVDFDGLRYSKCDGLFDKGKRKNIYTEEYSDSDVLRVWQGDDVTREATKITFTLYFLGDNRHSVYESFYNFVKNGKITYYDTKRKKEALLVLMDAVKISEDEWNGSIPYVETKFEFSNLWGECKDKEI